MKTNLNKQPDCSAKKSGAFTFIDLLAILAVVVVLILLQVPALAGVKGRTRVAQCASNVQQLTLALHLYAGEYSDKLPLTAGDPTGLPWSLPWDVGDKLLSFKLQKSDFYCPSTAPRFTDWENFAHPAENLWDYGRPSFHIAGYAFALTGRQLNTIYQNKTILTEPYTSPSYPFPRIIPPNSERVLVTDVVISGNNAVPASRNNNFDHIGMGFTQNGVQYPHLSAHLNGGMPQGQNIGYKDGHVQWKKFVATNPNNSDSKVRTVTGPYFWW